jgi:hypothetical protein
MKQFIYIGLTDNGVKILPIYHPNHLCNVRGWMEENVRDLDIDLMGWMINAEVGDMFRHRYGVCVRVTEVLI